LDPINVNSTSINGIYWDKLFNIFFNQILQVCHGSHSNFSQLFLNFQKFSKFSKLFQIFENQQFKFQVLNNFRLQNDSFQLGSKMHVILETWLRGCLQGLQLCHLCSARMAHFLRLGGEGFNSRLLEIHLPHRLAAGRGPFGPDFKHVCDDHSGKPDHHSPGHSNQSGGHFDHHSLLCWSGGLPVHCRRGCLPVHHERQPKAKSPNCFAQFFHSQRPRA
jgi:hypothetical protein